MSEEPEIERTRAIEDAIRTAGLDGSHRDHFRNLLDRLERDDVALIVLKGHLVIEERITAAIGKFVWHPEFLERARLNFSQKMQLARAISMDQSANSVWDLIDKLNAVRNKLAHSLDGGTRGKAIAALREAFAREVPDAATEELKDDKHLLATVISMSLGFVHSFEQEVDRFRHYVEIMDRVLNRHRHETGREKP